MSAGRTTWWPKDAAWHRRERIVELGEEFGAAGPNVIDVLSSWAQEQRAGGGVRGGFRSLAREAFVDVAEAKAIVERAAAIGALDDLDIEDVTVGHGRFVCRVSGWGSDQERGRAAFRKQAQRDREQGSHAESRSDRQSQSETEPDGDAESRSVTASTPPDLTRPDQKEEAPKPPEGGRQRDRERYEQQLDAWAAEHFPERDSRDIAMAVGMVTGGRPPRAATIENVTEWLRDRDARFAADDEPEPAAA